MRVTGGILRGHKFRVLNGKIRPTQERIREALFSILGERICGARFLDLFAGFGGVGLEAWSRGAQFVCWVELDFSVLSILKDNVRRLCQKNPSDKSTNVRVFNVDAIDFLKKRFVDKQFDIIFADPPYTRGQPASHKATPCHGGQVLDRRRKTVDTISENWCDRLLEALESSSMLARDGLFVIEEAVWARRTPCPEYEGWALVDERIYGDTGLRMFKRGLRAE